MTTYDLQKFTGVDSLSVLEAMRKIDENERGILMMIDHTGHLTGCLTDGDIRRYLMRGGKLEDNVVAAANRKPKFAHSLKEAARLFHQKNYIAIPVLDAEERLYGIYFGEGEIEKNRVPLKVPVVMNAGGRGSRLDPYTKILPKPLIPVGELPIMEHIMRQFMDYGCDQFHVIVNYKKEIIKGYFAENEGKYTISWYDEEKPLGTGGGLYLLKGKLRETFFFTNCDNLLLSNYDSIIRFHRENKNRITMICAYKNLQIPYGVVEMGQNGSILEMKEKPSFSFLSNTGIYVVEPEVLADMEDDVPIGFPDVVKQQKEKGERVAVYPVSENEWLDMGQLPELEKMREKLYGE